MIGTGRIVKMETLGLWTDYGDGMLRWMKEENLQICSFHFL